MLIMPRVSFDGAPLYTTAKPALTGNPSLRASWDFDDLTSLTLVDGKISFVNGVDGTVHALAQATEAIRPKHITLKNRGAAQFESALGTYLRGGDLGMDGQPASLVLVGEPAVLAQGAHILVLSGSNATYNSVRLTTGAGATGFSFSYGDNSLAGGANAGVAYPLGARLLVGTKAAEAGFGTLYVDSTANTRPQTSGQQPVASTLIANCSLGGNGNTSPASLLSNWVVWRALVFNVVLTSTNVDEIAAWARSIWGVGTSDSSSFPEAALSWLPPSDLGGVTGYKVFWSRTYDGETNSATVPVGTNSYTVTGLTGGRWHFKMRTLAGSVEGEDIQLGFKDIA